MTERCTSWRQKWPPVQSGFYTGSLSSCSKSQLWISPMFHHQSCTAHRFPMHIFVVSRASRQEYADRCREWRVSESDVASPFNLFLYWCWGGGIGRHRMTRRVIRSVDVPTERRCGVHCYVLLGNRSLCTSTRDPISICTVPISCTAPALQLPTLASHPRSLSR